MREVWVDSRSFRFVFEPENSRETIAVECWDPISDVVNRVHITKSELGRMIAGLQVIHNNMTNWEK